jgi:serine/threonine protein kinase
MQLARQLMIGLSLLHELDYVHRDIKPENIMFQRDGFLVVDVWLTHSFDRSHTQASSS